VTRPWPGAVHTPWVPALATQLWPVGQSFVVVSHGAPLGAFGEKHADSASAETTQEHSFMAS
jgi:hypothetical protein